MLQEKPKHILYCPNTWLTNYVKTIQYTTNIFSLADKALSDCGKKCFVLFLPGI